MVQQDTKDLLLRISEGDENAFKTLFYLYKTRLYAYIFKITKSSEIAEELVTDVFMKIWLSRDLIPKINHFDAFLFRIAYHKAIDFLRQAARDPVLHDLLWEKIQLAEETSADSNLLKKEYEKKLREAIGLLSPRKKMIFRMSRMEGLSHDQIAEKLHLSKNTVNNHIVEAKQFILAYLRSNPDLVILILLLSCFFG